MPFTAKNNDLLVILNSRALVFLLICLEVSIHIYWKFILLCSARLTLKYVCRFAALVPLKYNFINNPLE